MSKPSKKRASQTEQAENPHPGSAAEGTASEPASTVAWTIVFVVLGLLYAVYFYRVPISAGMGRYQTLGYLLIPDQLVSQWCDVPVGEISVLDRGPLLLLAGAVWGIAFLTGRLVLLFGPVSRHLNRLEFFAFAMGIGLSVWSLFTLAVGLLGGLRQPWIFVATAVLVVVASAVRAWRDSSRRLEPVPAKVDESPGPAPGRLWRPSWWWLSIPFVLVIVGALCCRRSTSMFSSIICRFRASGSRVAASRSCRTTCTATCPWARRRSRH